MGYTIPLRFVKVSVGRSDNKQSDVSICATRIIALMSTDIYQARKTITAEKRAGTLINAAGIEKVKTAIFLDNGSVVASPLSVNRLMTLIEKSNIKATEPKKTKRMQVYSVCDPEPDEDDDFENDVDAYYEDEEDE